MLLPIRARIALFGAAVVCTALVVFSALLFGIAWAGGSQTVNQDLEADNPATTFHAIAAPDGRLTVTRPGGSGPVPASIPAPVRPGISTVLVARNDRVRIDVTARSDGTYDVTGEHLSQLERSTGSLLTYLLFTALCTMLAAIVGTWIAAGRALRPLGAMAAVAEAVGRTNDLRRRLPAVEPPDDEVGRLTGAFNDMLTRLEATQESQRRFVADASHELRTPLTSIRGNAGLLQRDPPPPADDARDAVADIVSESERLSRLVDGLLTLARADAGHALRREPLDLAAVVEPVARRAGLATSLEPAPMVGDADALAQLGWILADNACRHGGGSGIMWVRRRPGGALLVVSDRGPGLPAGEEDLIFGRFYQPDVSRATGGTGLGLAIARWIVQQHGGRISAGNDPNGGAVFAAEL